MSRQLVWIDEKLASKLTVVNDIVEMFTDENIKKLLDKLEDDSSNMADCLDENILKFKLHATQVRDSYKKVVQEEVDKTYELWEECEKLRTEANKRLEITKGLIHSIKPEIDNVRKGLSEINIYGLDRLFDLVNKFNNMSYQDKDTLSKLFLLDRKA